jgi:hypothetical protein
MQEHGEVRWQDHKQDGHINEGAACSNGNIRRAEHDVRRLGLEVLPGQLTRHGSGKSGLR